MREAYVYSKYPVLESNMPPVLFAASDLWHEQALKHKLKDNEIQHKAAAFHSTAVVPTGSLPGTN